MAMARLQSRPSESDSAVVSTRWLSTTRKTDWFEVRDARLQLRPFSEGGIEMAVASAVSPAGATVAGRLGLGMLSVAAGATAGYDALESNWGVLEQHAADAGKTADRGRWRVVAPMHIAEEVMPRYPGSRAARESSIEWIGQNGSEFFGAMIGATVEAIKEYGPADGEG